MAIDTTTNEDISVADLTEIAATAVPAEVEVEAIPTVCPTCGTSRAGASGAAHGCAPVATMPSKSGTGIVYAPMATTDRCAQCGQKSHRNLPRHERDLICLWQQFSSDELPTEVKRDRFGVETQFALMNPTTVEMFSRWMDRGSARVAPGRTGRKAKPVVSVPTGDPVAAAIAADINAADAEEPKPKKMTKAQRIAAELARQQEIADNS